MWHIPDEALAADTPIGFFQMSPFDARYIETNRSIAQAAGPLRDLDWDRYLPGVYAEFIPTVNGRSALALSLANLELAPNDEVLIVTTSGSPYITACVTQEIEKTCRWSRALGNRTRAALIIHEFGFPATLPPDVAAAAAGGLPVIEDCAWAIGCAGPDGRVGQLGDFVVYSFPKTFPMAFGGLLKARAPLRRRAAAARLSEAGRALLLSCAQHYLSELEQSVAVRRANHGQYAALFAEAGFSSYFDLALGAVPHAFVVALDDEDRAKRARAILHARAVRSSVFYGAGGYYLPNHQNMGPSAVEYVHRRFLDAWDQARQTA